MRIRPRWQAREYSVALVSFVLPVQDDRWEADSDNYDLDDNGNKVPKNDAFKGGYANPSGW